MKKSIVLLFVGTLSVSLFAVPARRGWQTRTQADGTTVEIQLIGDEFCHYMINRDGKEVREIDGMYEVVGDAPSAQMVRARRAKAQARRAPKLGNAANLAPRGIVILANFADVQFNENHTQAVFDELCNSNNCTVNTYNGVHYPSAAEYFTTQSHGQYRPQFDVFGPVTLSHNYKYYGENDSSGDDKNAASAVAEACILADQEYGGLDFASYDSDNDGYVDFIYVIYAGKGEADGGNKNTIWPHNWSIEAAIFNRMCDYTRAQCRLDGKHLDNYAMSAELAGWAGSMLTGIGTLCHEFGHVMGLPDFYDTEYKTNYTKQLTPNEWDIMDAGSYNGNGHCPPNYSPWEKYFFGWHQPVNLGTTDARLKLEANGTEGYQAYQLNETGILQSATKKGINYYFENRQQQGWDEFVPASGLLIWKVNYDPGTWESNTPNNTANKPNYTVVCSSGTKIGSGYGSTNVFPYDDITSWNDMPGKPLTDITRDGDYIRLIHIAEPQYYSVKWMVNGELLETARYNLDGSENLRMPSIGVTTCEGTELVGWTQTINWFDPFTLPDDLFTTPSGKVTDDVTYHAVFK